MASKRIPKRIGAYSVEGKIASGGMGEVLLGNHQTLGRPCALKRLVPPDDAEDDLLVELEERFEREGKVLAQLHHQSICGVYDLFSWRGTQYIALEYVDGYDLRDLLKQGALPVDVALIVGIHVAEALQHAHMHGIIHRDVKPANVMVSRRGDVKLMDFGIARGDELEVLTRTGMLVGTPTYMAPEVLRGEEAGVSADIYSLSAALYRCLAGEGMFPKGQQPEVIYRHILEGKIRPLRNLKPEVPRSLATVIHKGLATNPAHRYGSAAELRNALQDELASFGTSANHAERLVQFLYADGHLSEEAAATVVQPEVLRSSRRETAYAPVRRQQPRSWIAAGALVTSITAVGLVGIWVLSNGAGDVLGGWLGDWVADLSTPPGRSLHLDD
ncbi:MAG TPA: serine/threonine protein kinase [Deltaproteobacteria bacterium]|nr:serine/threonine protein kinase [Deltaproteobacteria bacterium]